HRIHYEGRFECVFKDCNFVGNIRKTMHSHYNTCHGEFTCNFEGCGKSFGTEFLLKNHERSHTGARPFRCTWPGCVKDSGKRSDLTKHIRMVHFKLPSTLKEQQELGIVDYRDPNQFVDVIDELL